VLSMTDGEARPIALSEGARPWAAAWLPDNRHIVLSYISRPNFTLTMLDTESAAHRLIHRDSGTISAVAVSADGVRVAYTSGQPEWDIEEFAMDGTRRRAVASSSNMDRFASLSPRGDRFVFFVGGPGRPASIWTADAERGDAQQLIALAAGSLATSYHFSHEADGSRISTRTGSTRCPSGGRPVQFVASTELGSVRGSAGRPMANGSGLRRKQPRCARYRARERRPSRARSEWSRIAHRTAGGSLSRDAPATS
jgi:Tol biopolymer transport system component